MAISDRRCSPCMDAPRLLRLSRLRSRVAGWGDAGLVTAILLIAGSVAALDRHFLGHDDWGRDDDRGGGVVVLVPDRPGANQPGGFGRAEGGARAEVQRATGGTVAPEPPPSPARAGRRREEPPATELVRVRAPIDPPPPAVVR